MDRAVIFKHRAMIAGSAALGLAACTSKPPQTAQAPPTVTDVPVQYPAQPEPPSEWAGNEWESKATDNDKRRLEKWDEALARGRQGAINAGYGDKLSDRAPLFAQDAGLPDDEIPAGLYACSITKLDEKEGKYNLNYIAYPDFRCRVTDAGGRKQFVKLTGSQRTSGWIYAASDRRSVYLGSSFYGYEDTLTPYGETEERDQAAVVQRIGPNRWRMVFPFPYYESIVNVMELTLIQAE